ncbi:hypothetical protein GWK47_050588 [Chionoecetes opilio]|uniref:Uncharacterized protein n=1 Tax=Chionoecetes opilio TaxID=41210 RepID=A0A8J4YAN8_CHIOP|nr:hypothetical protein GWK47_050588 [Chionoecetes opilio]
MALPSPLQECKQTGPQGPTWLLTTPRRKNAARRLSLLLLPDLTSLSNRSNYLLSLDLTTISDPRQLPPAPLASAEIGLDVAAGEDSSTITTGNMAHSDCFDTDVGVLPKPQYQPQPPTT